MDFPDKPTILNDILILLQAQYKNNGYLNSFPLNNNKHHRPALNASKSKPINVLQEFGPHFHKDNLFLQHLILQYFVSVPPSPSLNTRYQMYSDLNEAYGRKRLLSDTEMDFLLTARYSKSLREFLSNPIVADGVVLYDIMQSMKIYELAHLFDRIEKISGAIMEENAKGAEPLSDRRLLRLLELDRRREELSMEEVVESFLPVKNDYEKDLEVVHRILEGEPSYMEEFPLLAATLGKDFEFASLLSVPPFSEELAAAIKYGSQHRQRRYRQTRKNKGSSK